MTPEMANKIHSTEQSWCLASPWVITVRKLKVSQFTPDVVSQHLSQVTTGSDQDARWMLDVDTRLEQVHIQTHNGTNTHTHTHTTCDIASWPLPTPEQFIDCFWWRFFTLCLNTNTNDPTWNILYGIPSTFLGIFFQEHVVDCDGRCWVVPWEQNTWVIYYDSPCSQTTLHHFQTKMCAHMQVSLTS